MRAIDGDALMEYLTMIPIDLGYREVEEIEEYVKQMPTIEPERKKGVWIRYGAYYDAIECECSRCGQILTMHGGDCLGYCPRCGSYNEVKRNDE